jgi:hypothetical protein
LSEHCRAWSIFSTLGASSAVALGVIGVSAVAAQPVDWTVTGRDGFAGVQTMSNDGSALLSGGCNSRLGPSFYVTLSYYEGDALQRVDDQSEQVIFEIEFRDGTSQPFMVPMHFFAPDEAHVLSAPLPIAFMEAFGRGDTLTIRNGAGTPVADWALTGAAAAVSLMREICEF